MGAVRKNPRKGATGEVMGSTPPKANAELPSRGKEPRKGAVSEAMDWMPEKANVSAPRDRTKSKAPRKGKVAEGAKTGAPILAIVSAPPGDHSTICAALQELQVRRKWCIGLMNKQTNASGALVRRAIGFRGDMEEADRAKITARAAKILAAALSGKEQAEDDADVAEVLSADFAVVALALAPLQKRRAEIEKEMEKLAKQLPIYAYAKAVKGFGDLALAVLVGESGDFSIYSSDDKLSKRLGLAPHEGKAYSTWRKEGGLTAEDWIEAGYNPRRRAEVHACIAEPMAKHQLESAEKSGTEYGRAKGPYGEVYIRRRERTAITHPDWTKAHSRNDALLVMSHKLVSDLWKVWRRANFVEHESATCLPPGADPLPLAAE